MQPNRSTRTSDVIRLNGKHIAAFVKPALIGWRWSLNNPPYGPVASGWTLTKKAAFRRVNMKETKA